jgi:hypothetical protein
LRPPHGSFVDLIGIANGLARFGQTICAIATDPRQAHRWIDAAAKLLAQRTAQQLGLKIAQRSALIASLRTPTEMA